MKLTPMGLAQKRTTIAVAALMTVAVAVVVEERPPMTKTRFVVGLEQPANRIDEFTLRMLLLRKRIMMGLLKHQKAV